MDNFSGPAYMNSWRWKNCLDMGHCTVCVLPDFLVRAGEARVYSTIGKKQQNTWTLYTFRNVLLSPVEWQSFYLWQSCFFFTLREEVFYLNRPNSSSTIKNTFRTMGWQTVKKLPGHFRKTLAFATRFHFYILLGNNTLWLSWPHKWQNWFETWILWACQIS